MTSYFRIGGLAMEPPLDLFDTIQAFIKTFPEKIDEYSNLLTGNPIFINRLKGVGYLSPKTRLRSASPARLCALPASTSTCAATCRTRSYEKFQFNVPVSNDWRLSGRATLLRLEEMRESVKIIQQALDGMPGGPVKADAPKIVLPDREADEDPDGVPDPSLQDRDRGLRRAGRRGLSGH